VLRAGLARVVLILGPVAVATGDPVPAVDDTAIIERVDRLLREDSSEGELTMAGSRAGGPAL
jgi:hypothetical protein